MHVEFSRVCAHRRGCRASDVIGRCVDNRHPGPPIILGTRGFPRKAAEARKDACRISVEDDSGATERAEIAQGRRLIDTAELLSSRDRGSPGAQMETFNLKTAP
jgi:hypothetical protein